MDETTNTALIQQLDMTSRQCLISLLWFLIDLTIWNF